MGENRIFLHRKQNSQVIFKNSKSRSQQRSRSNSYLCQKIYTLIIIYVIKNIFRKKKKTRHVIKIWQKFVAPVKMLKQQINILFAVTEGDKRAPFGFSKNCVTIFFMSQTFCSNFHFDILCHFPKTNLDQTFRMFEANVFLV